MQTIVAVVGGTGAEGSGLAARFAKAGVPVRIGSRNLEKAQETARRIGARSHRSYECDAVAGAGIVILTVPLSAQVETLKSIRGSIAPGAILVDATVPLEVAIGGRRLAHADAVGWLGRATSGAPCSRACPWWRRFMRLSAEALAKLDHPLDCDALDLRRQRGSQSGRRRNLPR